MLFNGNAFAGYAIISIGLTALITFAFSLTETCKKEKAVGIRLIAIVVPTLLIAAGICMLFFEEKEIAQDHQNYHQLADGTYDLLAVRVDAEDNQVLRLDIRSGDTVVAYTSPFTENLEGGICEVCGRSMTRAIQITLADADQALVVQDGAWTLRLSEPDLAILTAQGYKSRR